MSSLRYSRSARSVPARTSATKRYALKRDGKFQVRAADGKPRDCRDKEKPTPFSDYDLAMKTARYLNGQLAADDAMFEVVDYPTD